MRGAALSAVCVLAAPPIIGLLHRQIVDILHEPAVRSRIVEQGAEVVGSTPNEFGVFLKQETERLAAVIRNAKMQLD
jgi:tripartite-type tricarboxylate transporter receptor subunit TctC